MLSKLNLKRRAIFYSGLVLTVLGLMQLPASTYVKMILDGLLEFLYVAMIVIPIILVSVYFAPLRRTFLGVNLRILSTLTAIVGVITFSMGIIIYNQSIVIWGVFITLFAGEIMMLMPNDIDNPHSSGSASN